VPEVRAGQFALAVPGQRDELRARQLRERGVPWLLDQLPRGAPVFISFDMDGLDPSIASAVSGLSPGGLSFDEASDLLGGVADRCRIVGAAFTELIPGRDAKGVSTLVLLRLVMRLLAGIDRAR